MNFSLLRLGKLSSRELDVSGNVSTSALGLLSMGFKDLPTTRAVELQRRKPLTIRTGVQLDATKQGLLALAGVVPMIRKRLVV